MTQGLRQSEVEWLRCLVVSKKLTPVLPATVRRKLELAKLVEAKAGKIVLTVSGAAVLRQR